MAHGDFYFAINAMFYHFSDRWGKVGLIRYWETMGREYRAPLAEKFQAGGPAAIAEHWADFFGAEAGGYVEVSRPDPGTVLIDVKDCPAIRWMQENQSSGLDVEIHPLYCQHCYYVNRAMMENTDYEFDLTGGGGACQQTFTKREGES
jgi:hypothetical protein